MSSTLVPANMLTPALLEFVKTALSQKQLSGICEMLRSATETMDAWGCFLWQAVEDCDFDVDPPTGWLFVLAEWFPQGQTWAFERLELDSVAGWVAKHGEARAIDNASTDQEVGRSLSWWIRDVGVECFCSVPVRFSDGARAALTFYRTQKKPFTQSEIGLANQIGEIFPLLYQSIRNEVSFSLVRKAEEITTRAVPSTEEEVNGTVQELCELLASTFRCFEVSVYLEDRTRGVFERKRRVSIALRHSQMEFTEFCSLRVC